MAADLATRIKATFLRRRRQSSTPSLRSTKSQSQSQSQSGADEGVVSLPTSQSFGHLSTSSLLLEASQTPSSLDTCGSQQLVAAPPSVVVSGDGGDKTTKTDNNKKNNKNPADGQQTKQKQGEKQQQQQQQQQQKQQGRHRISRRTKSGRSTDKGNNSTEQSGRGGAIAGAADDPSLTTDALAVPSSLGQGPQPLKPRVLQHQHQQPHQQPQRFQHLDHSSSSSDSPDKHCHPRQGLTNAATGNDLQLPTPSLPPTPALSLSHLCSIDEDPTPLQQSDPPSATPQRTDARNGHGDNHDPNDDDDSSGSNTNNKAQADHGAGAGREKALRTKPLALPPPAVVLTSSTSPSSSSPASPASPASGSVAASAPASTSSPAPVSVTVSSPSGSSSSSSSSSTPSSTSRRPPPPPRRQSLIPTRHSTFIDSVLHTPLTTEDVAASGKESAKNTTASCPTLDSYSRPVSIINVNMSTRKIWVKRPHASATLVIINNDDLVDDVRDMILRKYANSLGKTFDAPDLTIRICPRDSLKDRVLGPEEPMGDTIDSYFPGGQAVGEALVIDIPRRTPKASPRVPHPPAAAIYFNEEGRPSENGEGYFPLVGASSPHLPLSLPGQANGTVPHSIAVLGSGQLPLIPSPGGTRTARTYRERPDRPRLGRTHTSSPNLNHNMPPASFSSAATTNTGMQHYRPRHSHSRTHSSSSEQTGIHTNAASMPRSPGPEPSPARISTPPPPRIASPRQPSARPKKTKRNTEYPSISSTMLNGSVPPISVLIVEDNPINLKLLEAFVKKLKVRWQTAMNGRDAVKKWRTGGFHLVLMDIQLPVMNGLEATREIRRLESLNRIGVFSLTPGSLPEATDEEVAEQDRLDNPGQFKSPVIIVALTASSLQSDRHEALAAGCNDFLTKPVNFVWLERKVMEWGCMQALIDFDGWRKWKDFSKKAEELEAAKKSQNAKAKSKKSRASISSAS